MLRRLLALAAPCYIANATPVVVAKVVGRVHPLDCGKRFVDGRRILGDGKSVEGFISGVLAGTVTGSVLELALGLSSVGEAFILSLGAMVGDVLGSFIKRRLGLERGEPAPLLDQLTFLLVALLLYHLIYNGLNALVVAALIVITPPLHVATNYLAYRLGLKDRPW